MRGASGDVGRTSRAGGAGRQALSARHAINNKKTSTARAVVLAELSATRGDAEARHRDRAQVAIERSVGLANEQQTTGARR